MKFFKKNFFLENILKVSSGTLLSQILIVIFTPVFTRIYSIEDFGIYAVFTSLVALSSVFVSGKFEYAILSEKKDEDAASVLYLVILTSLINIFFLFLLLILIYFFFNIFFLKITFVYIFLFLFSIFTSSTHLAFNNWLNRNKKYKLMTNSLIFGSITNILITLFVGIFTYNQLGLIFGLISGQLVNILIIYFKIKEDFSLYNFKLNKIYMVAKKNIKFPKFLIFSGVFERFSLQGFIIISSSIFGTIVAGYMGLYLRVISLPNRVVSKSIGIVFRQQANSLINKNGECEKLFFYTLLVSFSIALFPFLLLLFYGPLLFAFFFGDEWYRAGEYASILSWSFLLSMLVTPISSVLPLKNKQKYDLKINIFLSFLTLFSLYIGYLFKDFSVSIIFYTMFLSVRYLIDLVVTWNVVKKKD